MDELIRNRRKSRAEEKLRYITRYSVYLDGRMVCPLAMNADNCFSDVGSGDWDYDDLHPSSCTAQNRDMSGDELTGVHRSSENFNEPSHCVFEKLEPAYSTEGFKMTVGIVQKVDTPLLPSENIYFRKRKITRRENKKAFTLGRPKAVKSQSFSGYESKGVRRPIIVYPKKVQKPIATVSCSSTSDGLLPKSSKNRTGFAPLATCEDFSVSSNLFEVDDLTSTKGSSYCTASNLSAYEYDEDDNALLPLRSLAKYIVHDIVVPNSLKNLSDCSLDQWTNIPLNNRDTSSSKFSTSSSCYCDTSLHENCQNQNFTELTMEDVSFLNFMKHDDNVANFSKIQPNDDCVNRSTRNAHTSPLPHVNTSSVCGSDCSLPVSYVNEGIYLNDAARENMSPTPIKHLPVWIEDGRSCLLVRDLPPISTGAMQKQQFISSMEMDGVSRQKLFAPELDDVTLRNFCSPPYPFGQYGGAMTLPRDEYADERKKHLENLRPICAREEARAKPRHEDEGSDSKFNYFATETLRELASRCLVANSSQMKNELPQLGCVSVGDDATDMQQPPRWSDRWCFASIHKGELKLEKAEDVWLIYKEVPLTEDVQESPLEKSCLINYCLDNVLLCPANTISIPSLPLPSSRCSTLQTRKARLELIESNGSFSYSFNANKSHGTAVMPDEHLHLSNFSEGVELFKSKLELDLLRGRDKHSGHRRCRETDIDADAELTANEYSVTVNASSIDTSTSSSTSGKNVARSHSISIYCQFKQRVVDSLSSSALSRGNQATAQDKYDESDCSMLSSGRLEAINLSGDGSGDATNSREFSVSCQSSRDKKARAVKKRNKRSSSKLSSSSSLCSCWGRKSPSDSSVLNTALPPSPLTKKKSKRDRGASDVEQLQSPLVSNDQPVKPPGVSFRRKQYQALHRRHESSRMESVLEEVEGGEAHVTVSMPAQPVRTEAPTSVSNISRRRMSTWKKKRDKAKFKQQLAEANVIIADRNERDCGPEALYAGEGTSSGVPAQSALWPDLVAHKGGHASATCDSLVKRGHDVTLQEHSDPVAQEAHVSLHERWNPVAQKEGRVFNPHERRSPLALKGCHVSASCDPVALEEGYVTAQSKPHDPVARDGGQSAPRKRLSRLADFLRLHRL